MAGARVARPYAMALLAAAGEAGTVDAVAADLERVARALEASHDLRLLVASPVISPARKSGVLRELFARRVGEMTMEFLLLLVQKGREGMLQGIIEEFRTLGDERAGVVNVQVTSALPLAEREEAALTEQLERYTQKKVRLRLKVDRSIRGGLVMQIHDRVLDASVTHQLEQLRARFRGVKLRTQG